MGGKNTLFFNKMMQYSLDGKKPKKGPVRSPLLLGLLAPRQMDPAMRMSTYRRSESKKC